MDWRWGPSPWRRPLQSSPGTSASHMGKPRSFFLRLQWLPVDGRNDNLTIVAVVFSAFAYSYFFTAPLHSLVLSHEDLPHLVPFTSFALLVGWFTLVRRRVERNARTILADQLEIRSSKRMRSCRRASKVSRVGGPMRRRDAIFVWDKEGNCVFMQRVGRQTTRLRRERTDRFVDRRDQRSCPCDGIRKDSTDHVKVFCGLNANSCAKTMR